MVRGRGVSESGDGTTWETALKTIQEGINASSDGDTVTVAQGTYLENVLFDGKNIVLTRTDPLDPSVVANTIIDGKQSGSVVTFSGTESEACILSGFTIRNGSAVAGGGICGRTATGRSGATIRDNVITQNAATGDLTFGGGLAYCDGLIRDNIIESNSVSGNNSYGGGLYSCNGTIRGNTISANLSEGCGGGLYDCDGVIRNNVITENSSANGAGLAYCDGVIENNLISQNWGTGAGGGLYVCHAIVLNNTIVANSGGILSCHGTILNCVIWDNGAWTAQVYQSSIPARSCIQDWSGGWRGEFFSRSQIS